MVAAMVSRVISSGVLIRRASRKTCWPSTTSRPAASMAASTGSSATSIPTGSPARPWASSSRLILAATPSAMPAAGLKAPRRVEIPARARPCSGSSGRPSSQGL